MSPSNHIARGSTATLLLLPFLVAGCRTVADDVAPESIVLARVNGEELMLSDAMNTYVASHGGHEVLVRGEPAVRELAGRLVERQLFYAEARTLGIPEQEDILVTVEEHRYGQAEIVFWRREVEEQVQVSDAEVEEFYAKTDVALAICYMELETLEEAEALRERVRAGEDFEELASEHSIHTSRSFGGVMSYVRRGDLLPSVEQVVFVLEEPGELTEVVGTEESWAFARLDERITNPDRPPRDVMLPRIRNILEDRAEDTIRAAVEERLRSAAQVEIEADLATREVALSDADDETELARSAGEALALQVLREALDLDAVALASSEEVDPILGKMVEDWAMKRAVHLAIRESGLLDDPEVIEKNEAFARDAALSTLYRDYVFADLEMSDDDLRAYYEKNKETGFTRPVEIRLAYVVTAGLEEAQELRQRVEAGESLEDLARQHSIDPTAMMTEGRAQWLRPGQILAEVEEVAFGLEVGEIGGPVPTPAGYFLLQVYTRKEPQLIPFEKARGVAERRLGTELQKEVYQVWVERLRERAAVELDERGIRQAVAWLERAAEEQAEQARLEEQAKQARLEEQAEQARLEEQAQQAQLEEQADPEPELVGPLPETPENEAHEPGGENPPMIEPTPHTRPGRRVLLALGFALTAIAGSLALSCEPAYRTSRSAGRSSGGGAGAGVARTCVDCHEDFVQALAGVSPHFGDLQGRCEDCHDRHGLVGVLKLKTAEPALCVDCHAETASFVEGGHPHVTAVPCSDCHDPHGANGEALLETPQPELCLTCHDEAAYKSGNVHAPVVESCSTCHDPHTSAAEGGLVAAVPGLCMQCHDGATPAFAEAHQDYDVRGSDCSSCHAAHTSDDTGLLRAVFHEPVADDCTMCHVDVEDATPGSPETHAPADKLCSLCHRDSFDAFAERESHHLPVAEGRCVDCHAPHGSDHAGLLVASVEETCAACHETHTELAELSTKPLASLHAPVVEGQCLACHDPHGGEDAYLFPAPEDELCLSCHEDVSAQFDLAAVHAPLDTCTSCHEGHGSRTVGMLRSAPVNLCLSCHGDIRERMKSEDVHRPVAQGQCLTCHDPHASDHAGELRVAREDLCSACHADVLQPQEGHSFHPPVGKGECFECHDAHSSPHPGLLVEAEADLCARCHGLTAREIERSPVKHAPAEAGACLVCHEPHSGPREHLLALPERDMCGACHADVFTDTTQPGSHAHAPVAEGSCLECHLPHASEFTGLATAEGALLCWKCHDPDAPELAAAHLGLLEVSTDCAACHTPHASPGRGLLWPNRHEPFAEKNCDECHDEGK